MRRFRRQNTAVRNASAAVTAITSGGTTRMTVGKRITAHARLAVRLLPFTQTSVRSTARSDAFRLRERQAAKVNEDLFASLLAYKSIMAQAKVLLRRGIITKREYTHFDTMFTKKYGLSLDSIFRERS